MTERRYTLYMMNNKRYVIDEEDLKKIKVHANEMLVTLKQCIIHPASITVIEPFELAYIQRFKTEKRKREIEGSRTVEDMVSIPDGEPEPPPAIQDLFTNKKLLGNDKN